MVYYFFTLALLAFSLHATFLWAAPKKACPANCHNHCLEHNIACRTSGGTHCGPDYQHCVKECEACHRHQETQKPKKSF
ncbi:hypothetical protein EIL50_01410 [bacterium NHP-B]|nr:hypothetical protein EIL50_01410 [bacterium NHP-B]